MSQLLINAYLSELDRIKKFSGSLNEQTIRRAFERLLDDWARQNDLFYVSELEYDTSFKTKVYPDGTILHSLRVPLGFWEAKDTKDDIDTEIAKKIAKGYPNSNIIYENTETAVLIQNKQEVMRCSMMDVEALNKLLSLFFSYEREEIAEFRKAVAQFKADLPAVLEALRAEINTAYKSNTDFKARAAKFLAHAKDTINPTVSEEDVREMLIQHILTEEIFAHVFNESDFHRENNIAKELYELENLFFKGAVKKDTLKGLEPYYAAIRANAAQITAHSEKQTFLKLIYENFYKEYNPKAADRLGVVYTPNEIVRFMIEGADWLTHKHFGKSLIDKGVEILDPATGTGTFVCELIEYFRGQPQKLAQKYKEELHANEVAILPYYVANLNIEATYATVSGQFAEFPNLCFVDTLDNVAGLGIRSGHQHELFGAMSEENVERIKRQNRRKISVIIGNPPYNANQQNENDNNKNRAYPKIDDRIKQSYIRLSTAQKTKVYDMYSRFFRWSADRLHDDGVIAFVTNRSFIDSRTFDGFRRSVSEEFNEIYVVDLGGDVRANPKLSGTKNNVFGIQTGVAISFLVKKKGAKGCKIFYARRPEFDTKDDKLAFLGSEKLSTLKLERVEPDKNQNWINLTDNDWDDLIPVADKPTKAAKGPAKERAIFKLFSLGVVTNRDDWIYDFDSQKLEAKTIHFMEVFNSDRHNWHSAEKADITNFVSREIKWTSELESSLKRNLEINFNKNLIIKSLYRPYTKKFIYFDRVISHRVYQYDSIFPIGKKLKNSVMNFMIGERQSFAAIASSVLPNLAMFSADPAQGLPRYRYTAEGEKIDNITNWGLKQFESHYGKGEKISKDAIFHYVYGVLHDPLYREKYALNLKREFPRIPFYPDFWQWAKWGEALMALHINYEEVDPFGLKRMELEHKRAEGTPPVAKLKADKDNHIIILDSDTQLTGVPPAAWDYKLGNRSALEWILDQYKEKKPKDPTIAAKFNTYRFADYKEQVIDLLDRVATVSVKTVEIQAAMAAQPRAT